MNILKNMWDYWVIQPWSRTIKEMREACTQWKSETKEEHAINISIGLGAIFGLAAGIGIMYALVMS